MIKSMKNRIFLKKDIYPEKIGLIYIPIMNNLNGKTGPPYSGTIISISPDIKDPDFKVGDRILFHDMSGFEFVHDGEKIFSIRDIDVIAILMDKDLQIL